MMARSVAVLADGAGRCVGGSRGNCRHYTSAAACTVS
jgi:hypothetical protein